MSGSDDRNRGGLGGAGGSDDGPDCSDLRFTTTLASPQPDVVAALAVGVELEVRIASDEVSYIGVYAEADVLVGTVVGGRLRLLRQCLQRGVRYAARVVSIDESAVEVEIAAVS